MKKLTFCSGIAVAAVLAASGAEAAQCEGVDARLPAEPVIIHEAEDGTTTMLIRSSGTSTITSPAEMTGGASWRHCVGLLTFDADNSSSASGNCYSLDADGDQWIISWEEAKGSGTWAHASGTGKYASRSNDKGTWKLGTRFADGMRIFLWEGNCGD